MGNHLVKDKIISLINNGLEKGDVLRENLDSSDIIKGFDLSINELGVSETELVTLIDQIVQKSVNTNHSYFMNQMYGKLNSTSIYGDILTTLLNTSMYTYEVAPLLTLIEKSCIAKLSASIWGNDGGDGVFTPGGSISNMKGLMLARNSKLENVKTEGLGSNNFSIFISDQAHYSFLKAAIMMGFGSESVIKVKTNDRGQLIVEDLLTCIDLEKKKGRVPLMLVGVAGTTFSGVFDALDVLSDIAKENDMWYHVDAVYGGSLLFSEKEKHKFKGIDKADSVSWNLHKVMGMPLICSAFFSKKQGLLNDAFAVNADYIFHDDNDLDLGHKSIQCGRRVDALKLWLTWKAEGNQGFESRIDGLMRAANTFADIVSERDNMELLFLPESPIVIFRVKYDVLNREDNNRLNKEVRNQIFEEGNFLFNYSEYKEAIYLRCVVSDPELQKEQIICIVDEIALTAEKMKGKKASKVLV